MTPFPAFEAGWLHLAEGISRHMGLHFPPERWDDLRRGVERAAQELGCEGDALGYVTEMLAHTPSRKQLEVLASHLTVGETYFFRDSSLWQALEEQILPELIRARRGKDQRIRIWSAGCCSGEEPYSMAILLHRLLPDLRSWNITITATDINPRFLAKAARGTYGEWSFRNAPAWLKNGYFKKAADGRYHLAREIKDLVQFRQLNLAEEGYPAEASNTHSLDFIFCRNVLMYFSAAHIAHVTRKLELALSPEGWIAVSPSEASCRLFPDLRSAHVSGTILFQKRSSAPALAAASGSRHETHFPKASQPSTQVRSASRLNTSQRSRHLAPRTNEEDLGLRKDKHASVSAKPTATVVTDAGDSSQGGTQARALANVGELKEALVWCDHWIAAEKLNPAAYYLRAVILQEQGEEKEAKRALQQAVFLEPSFVMAHFSLGLLARTQGREDEAARHFNNAQYFLGSCGSEDVVAESGGLTAGRLMETLDSFSRKAAG